MAPGSSSLLRARRRDATLKPNRVLDKSSSRGMIYENEELRLRTININAEVERSQSDIKKLRRENEHLRREIWALRDECDRLEELIKRKEEEEDDQEEEDEEEEEEDGSSSDEENKEDGQTPKKKRGRKGGVLSSLGDTLSVVQEETEDTASREPTPMMNENPERRCDLYEGILPPLLRVHCVHPFTAAASIDSSQLPALTVGEVIESCWKTVGSKLEGVRLLGGTMFLSLKDQSALENLISKGLTLRGIKLDLEDVSQGTLVLAMSGVPHTLEDPSLAKVLSQFGPIIGYIERRLYRNVDTGERLARIRLMSSLPKRIYVEGHEISIRSLPHDELAKLATLPSRIVRSTLQVREIAEGSSSPNATRNAAAGGGESETSGSTRRSRQRFRRGHSPSSSSEQESPNKPARRKVSVRRRDREALEDSILLDRERSGSLSSRCSERRKLSITGRESGKLPWFGCWGNGCI